MSTARRPMSVSATGKKASRLRPYSSIQRSQTSCGVTECSTGYSGASLWCLRITSPFGSIANPTLKKRSGKASANLLSPVPEGIAAVIAQIVGSRSASWTSCAPNTF